MKLIERLVFWFLSIKNLIFRYDKSTSIVIWTLPHTLYIANIIYSELKKYNSAIKVEIINGRTIKIFNKNIYFVLCPQVLKKMPPTNKAISIQMEQCVSDWFSEEYFIRLNNSAIIYDYSKRNIDFLLDQGLNKNKIKYFPICAFLNYKDFLFKEYSYIFEGKKNNDILFYGNLNSSRRQRLLKVLKNNFQVRIEESLYGYDMLKAIDESKIVINLHYYESALLETTRIYECLSMGACVVSEISIDLNDYPHLLNSKQISFFNIDDDEDMIKKIELMLNYSNSNNNVFNIGMLKESYNIFQRNVNLSLKEINLT